MLGLQVKIFCENPYSILEQFEVTSIQLSLILELFTISIIISGLSKSKSIVFVKACPALFKILVP